MKPLHPLTLIPLFVTLGACQMISDDELAKRTDTLTDADNDGFTSTEYGGNDCDDDDEAINPAVAETPYDGIDNDCSGQDLTDVDGDGYDADIVGGDDCNDDDGAIHPDGVEVCDSVDNNCNEMTDEAESLDATMWYADADGDTYGNPGVILMSCLLPDHYVLNADDCDDTSDIAHPGGTEVCGDGLDNDCNDAIDEDAAVDAPTWYADADGDDFGDPDTSSVQCDPPDGYVADNTDCNDDADGAHPGGIEVCGDGLDNDCNDAIDEDAAVDAPTWYADADGDEFGDPDTSSVQCDAPSGYIDDGTDCNDDSEDSYPGGTEICGDGLDNDCNDQIDEGTAVDASTWYADGDHDGFGDPDTSLVRCDAPSGYVPDNTDCLDDSAYSYPGAVEVLGDDLDSDCNGDNNGFEFVSVPTDGNVLQGPVLTRHGTFSEEKIRVAWTTKECDKDGLTVHNCVIVETRPGVDIHTATSHLYIASHPAAIGSETYGFDFVSNETHWGWVRAISGLYGPELELGGHDISTGSTTTLNIKALPDATEYWTDIEAGLSSTGQFSTIACSDAAVGSPGIVANLLDLAEFSEGGITESYQDTIDEPYKVCAWDPLSQYYYLLSMYPTYTWDRWKFTLPVYDTLTYTDSWEGYPILDLEMKKDVGYFGRAYLVDTEIFPGGSEMYLDFAELDTPFSYHHPLNLELQPVELDLALTRDGRVLVCSLTEDGTPLLQLINPSDPVEPLTVDVIPNTELAHIIDCSIAINQSGEALVVYRSDYTLFEGHFDLL